MIKYFCDRCGKECKEQARLIGEFACDAFGVKIVQYGIKHLCEGCSDKLDMIEDQLEHEEDILDMTDEDVELLRYTFKVGDRVITDDGRTGTIEDICTCDRCKERGFYEPTVDFGDYIDYVSISDKNDGFKSYYQIGDRVFGNLNEEAVSKEIDDCEKKMLRLYEQLGTITKLNMIHQHKQKENTDEI